MEHSHLLIEKFVSLVNVSRETLDKLICYHGSLAKWQPKINLVSPTTLENAWERHFLDSAQLYPLLSYPDKSIFDLGSGAGFPGLVLSIMGAPQITLLESDQRKCIFLSEVIRQTNATAKVLNARIESLKKEEAMTITSRACASLNQLLFYALPLLAEGGECLFLKGRGAEQEIEEARREWMFHVEHYPSLADKEGVVLRITKLKKKG